LGCGREDPAMRWASMSLVLIYTGLVAQQPVPDAASITKALGGDKAIDVAWAAHHARDLGDKQLAKPLQQALSTWRTSDDPDAPTVRLLLLDALVHLAPRMPAADLLPLLDDPVCGIAAFVLVAREPAHNEAALFALFRSDWESSEATDDKPLPRRAQLLGNLLVSRRVPGFAAEVASHSSLDLELTVVEAQREMAFEVRLPKIRHGSTDWPPFPSYRFQNCAELVESRASAVEMPAPMTGAVLRSVVSRTEQQAFASGMSADPPSRQRHGIDWLCTLAEQPLPVAPAPLTFTTPATVLAKATAARAERQQLLDTLRERLVANASMSADEAKVLDHKVQVRFVDHRTNRTIPLPEIPPAR
jgi:hypothetical protein